MKKRAYRVRYFIEPWNKPIEGTPQKVRPGVSISSTDYGYADGLFVASIMHKEDGSVGSVILLDDKDGPEPSREVLELVRDMIDHYLEHHVEGAKP